VSVKVSVLLRDDIHRKLKLASVQRGTSIQDFMESAARKLIDPDVAPSLSPREIRMWQDKLKNVLENGDHLARLNCTASIEAMDRIVREQQEHDTNVISDNGRVISAESISSAGQRGESRSPTTGGTKSR
jgi:hypothetical protein